MEHEAWIETVCKTATAAEVPEPVAKFLSQNLGNMLMYMSRDETYKKRMDPKAFQKVVPDAQNFEAFLKANLDALKPKQEEKAEE